MREREGRLKDFALGEASILTPDYANKYSLTSQTSRLVCRRKCFTKPSRFFCALSMLRSTTSLNTLQARSNSAVTHLLNPATTPLTEGLTPSGFKARCNNSHDWSLSIRWLHRIDWRSYAHNRRSNLERNEWRPCSMSCKHARSNYSWCSHSRFPQFSTLQLQFPV